MTESEYTAAADAFCRVRDATGDRWFFSDDNSGHNYLVPYMHREEWKRWKEIPEDDPRSWDVPDFAFRLDGIKDCFTFSQVKVFKL